VAEVGGASAAEKEQKKQEHEVDTTQINTTQLRRMIEEYFAFRGFVGKGAEIQETLGDLKNKAQGAVPHRWSDKRSVSECFALFPWPKWKESSEKT
jgi:hypothetical protein